mmetsp:Transcript_100268/g.146362  ORF Transcript_100268/g.146362 Transcript_100268/m.146362 type:complete len:88 (+) Transcript_100268:38-301(+)
MFALLSIYGTDGQASMYATQMHSDSGYLVTSPDGSASYSGYLTWDDHSPIQLAVRPAPKAIQAKVVKTNPLKSLNGCLPFGCINGIE